MKTRKIRYAVVGQGHIAQVAVLPGFKKTQNSEITALISGSPSKLSGLAKKYNVSHTYGYDQYDACLTSGEIDAVYIALPNHLHKDFAIRAVKAGIHVLCEKPLAVTSKDCKEIITSAEKNKVKLMVAYRLHFDPSTLGAIMALQSGKIGELRYFSSEFGYELKSNNIRSLAEESGGPIHDIGIYCINAARYFFRSEPLEVFAYATNSDHRRRLNQETVSAVMRFPGERLATFTCSFNSGAISNCRVVGKNGDLFIDRAYEYVGKQKITLTVKEKQKSWQSTIGDQFGAEIRYFSDCIINDKNPAPSGAEGLADVRVIEALYASIQIGKPVFLNSVSKPLAVRTRPTGKQRIKISAHREPKLIKVENASK